MLKSLQEGKLLNFIFQSNAVNNKSPVSVTNCPGNPAKSNPSLAVIKKENESRIERSPSTDNERDSIGSDLCLHNVVGTGNVTRPIKIPFASPIHEEGCTTLCGSFGRNCDEEFHSPRLPSISSPASSLPSSPASLRRKSITECNRDEAPTILNPTLRPSPIVLARRIVAEADKNFSGLKASSIDAVDNSRGIASPAPDGCNRRQAARRLSLSDDTPCLTPAAPATPIGSNSNSIRRRRGSTVLASSSADSYDDTCIKGENDRPAEPINSTRPFKKPDEADSFLKKSGVKLREKETYSRRSTVVETKIPHTIPEDW